MVDPASIEQSIRAALDCHHVEVHGDDGTHFEAVIVSPQFANLPRVKQHQLVDSAHGSRKREEIHALSMKTLSPDEWAAR